MVSTKKEENTRKVNIERYDELRNKQVKEIMKRKKADEISYKFLGKKEGKKNTILNVLCSCVSH